MSDSSHASKAGSSSTDPLPTASPWGAGFDITALAAAVRRQQQGALQQVTAVDFVGPAKGRSSAVMYTFIMSCFLWDPFI